MNLFFCIMLPSTIGLSIYYSLIDKKDYVDILLKYLMMVLLSNFVMMIVLLFVAEGQISIIDSIRNNLVFSTKYVFGSITVNIVLGFVFAIVKKCFIVTLESKKINEKSIKNK